MLVESSSRGYRDTRQPVSSRTWIKLACIPPGKGKLRQSICIITRSSCSIAGGSSSSRSFFTFPNSAHSLIATQQRHERVCSGAAAYYKMPTPKLRNFPSSGCLSTLTVIGSRSADSRGDKVEPFILTFTSTTQHLPPPHLLILAIYNQTKRKTHTYRRNAVHQPSTPPLHSPPLPHALSTTTTTTPPAFEPSSNPMDLEHNDRASASSAKLPSHSTTYLQLIAARVPSPDPPSEPCESTTAPRCEQRPYPTGTGTGTGTSPRHASTPQHPALPRL